MDATSNQSLKNIAIKRSNNNSKKNSDKILNDNFEIEIGSKSEIEWANLLDNFQDSNFYQTKTFGAHSVGGKLLEHFILRKNGNLYAIAEVRISVVSFLNRGIAYIRWGPLWQLKGEKNNLSKLEFVLRILYNEYVKRRRLTLRVFPHFYVGNGLEITKIFKNAGFHLKNKKTEYKTIIVNINSSIDEIRSNLKSKWRNRLKKSERNNFKVISGHNDSLFNKFFQIYHQMHETKKFDEHLDIDSFGVMQHELPEKLKMRVILAQANGKPAAALVGTAIGETGICLLAASNKLGRNLSASYKLHMKMIEWLKEMKCNYYDLGGIDPVKNPGGYRFKSGFNGKEVTFIGQFQACICPISWLITILGEVYLNLISYFKK